MEYENKGNQKVEITIARMADYEGLEDELTGLQAKYEKAVELLGKVLDKMKHWHCWGRDNEGMVVSADSVRDLWESRTEIDTFLKESKGG